MRSYEVAGELVFPANAGEHFAPLAEEEAEFFVRDNVASTKKQAFPPAVSC